MNINDKLTAFVDLLTRQQRARHEKEYTHPFTDDAHFHLGAKYARVDLGGSGRYMVDLATEEIFGIKGYGVIHRGHKFGTLDTIRDWDWSDYQAIKLQPASV